LPTYFFDTSALAKRYVNEIGSAWVAAVTDRMAGNTIYLLGVTEVEVPSAVTRRRRSGMLTATDAAAILTQFRQELVTEYHIIDVTPTLLSAAVLLVETHGLRAYDAMQLAAVTTLQTYRVALVLPDLILVSADHELNVAATVESLTVEDPNAHL
jgi:predicted nucleic acid-binding protein